MAELDQVSVSALGYMGVAVADPSEWMRFGTQVLGLMPAAADDGMNRLRVDQRSWRIAASQGPQNDISFAGFEVSNDDDLTRMQAQLERFGVDVTVDDGALAADRGVTRLICCKDPDGLDIEIFHGAAERFETPFNSPRAVSGFVTGDQGLGHIVLGAEEIDATRAFYVEALGFQRSDVIRMEIRDAGQIELEFYHCNARHHTLALLPFRPARRLRHFMLQSLTLDDVGFTLDRVMADGAKLTATLGRHTNDHMISFYALTPPGIEIEFGFGARTVDDATWQTALHHSPSIWGHKRS